MADNPNASTPMPEAEVLALQEASTSQTAKKPHKPKQAHLKKQKPLLKPASIHLNAVTSAQLDRLPGVGPKLAQRIIDYRKAKGSFSAIEDLKNVKGIGDKNFEKMKLYLAL